jgi:tripartite-type tricarboxylate transporter receptor subunit TctC
MLTAACWRARASASCSHLDLSHPLNPKDDEETTMPHPTRRQIALAATLAPLARLARAQDSGYPKQPLHFVVPFTAGSGTDVIARTVGEQLEKSFKQSIVIDNKPGAGGTLGAALVAAAEPDGYTVLVHSAGHVANAALYPSLKYDTLKDFTPVTMLATLPNVLVTSPNSDIKTVQDLVKHAKANPGKQMYGSAGNGSATHLNAEKFRSAVDITANHVPFRGTPEALNEVMAGRLDWFFAPLVSALQLIQGGKLVALAVGTPKRSPALPNVPTTLEAGYADSDYTFWVGMFVSSKVPAPVVAKLHDETVKVLGSEAVRARFVSLGAEAAPMPQPKFAELITNETAAASVLIKRVGMKLD